MHLDKKEKLIIFVYADNCIIILKEKADLASFIHLQAGPKNFVFLHECPMSTQCGVEIDRLPGGDGFMLPQPFLIKTLNYDIKTTDKQWDNNHCGTLSFPKMRMVLYVNILRNIRHLLAC